MPTTSQTMSSIKNNSQRNFEEGSTMPLQTPATRRPSRREWKSGRKRRKERKRNLVSLGLNNSLEKVKEQAIFLLSSPPRLYIACLTVYFVIGGFFCRSRLILLWRRSSRILTISVLSLLGYRFPFSL